MVVVECRFVSFFVCVLRPLGRANTADVSKSSGCGRRQDVETTRRRRRRDATKLKVRAYISSTELAREGVSTATDGLVMIDA